MAIIVPEQEDISLRNRGSRISPVDTYSRPSAPPPADTSIGDAMATLGSALAGIGSAQAKKQEAEDLKNIEYYNSLVNDVQLGTPVAAQVDPRLADVSTSVRARVYENLGYRHAEEWFAKSGEPIFNNPQLRTNPEAVQAEKQRILAEAAKAAGGDNKAYSAGFLQAVKGKLNQADATATGERLQFYQTQQRDQFLRTARERAEQGFGASTEMRWQTVARSGQQFTNLRGALEQGKATTHIDNLNAEFATRVDRMIGEAPPEIKRGLQVISGYRSPERQKELYEKALRDYGSPSEARKWVAPPGRSNHNHGEAMDLRYASPEVRKWVHDNADKYGLYFPLKNEPWHVEMKGGRREAVRADAPVMRAGGADIYSIRPSSRADGNDQTNIIDRVMPRLIGQESSGDPNAKNPRSSAFGLGQYINSTWISSIRRHRPDLATGKTEDQILSLRRDGDLNKEILRKDMEGYERSLRSKGLPVTEGGIYLNHFLGEGGAEKVLKARGGTPLTSLLTPQVLKANPFLANMTASELRQWSEEKMGGEVNGHSAARNAIRATDREFATSSSLTDIYRREILVNGFIDMAKQSADSKYLSFIPPEYLTPETRTRLVQAEAEVASAQLARARTQEALRDMEEKKVYEDMEQKVLQKIAKGEQIDLVKDATGPDGKINRKAWDFVKTNLDATTVSPVQSALNTGKLQTDIMEAAATEDWKRISPQFDGEPSDYDLQRYIAGRTDIGAQERTALMQKVRTLRDAAVFAKSPNANEHWKNIEGYLRWKEQGKLASGASGSPGSGGLNKMAGFSLAYEGENFFRSRVRMMTKAWMEDNAGKGLPQGNAELTILQQAADATFAHLERMEQVVQRGMPLDKARNIGPMQDQPPADAAVTAPQGSTQGTPQYEIITRPDGKREIRPAQPQVQPQAQPPQVRVPAEIERPIRDLVRGATEYVQQNILNGQPKLKSEREKAKDNKQ
jgi:LAS superfamily LD-carboxypeptidase LdcB